MRRQVMLLLLVVGVVYSATGIYQVGPDERAVLRRFGRVVARPGPGLGFGFPYGIELVDKIQVRTVRQLDVGFSPEATEDSPLNPPGQFLTGDQNLVNIKLVVEYAINDRESALESYLAERERVEAVLSRHLESLVMHWCSTQDVDTALLAGRAELPRWLMPRAEQVLESLNFGIVLQRISVDYIAAPTEVRDSFEAVNQAQTAIRTREYQAEQEAELRRREAEALQYKLLQQAEAYKTEKLTLARAEAAGFLRRLEQYRQLKATNPNILASIWWDEMGRVLQGLKGRGRVDVWDEKLSPNGLDITQFLPPKKK